MKRVAIPALSVVLAIGCATVKKPAHEKEKPREKGPDLVGIVASIPRSGSFVLIRSYGPWTVPPGSVITSRGEEERTANLRFTGEKLGQFAAADIQSGEVEKGDAVYSFHKPKANEVNFTPEMPAADAGQQESLPIGSDSQPELPAWDKPVPAY